MFQPREACGIHDISSPSFMKRDVDSCKALCADVVLSSSTTCSKGILSMCRGFSLHVASSTNSPDKLSMPQPGGHVTTGEPVESSSLPMLAPWIVLASRHWPSFLLMLCSFTNQVLAQLDLLRYWKESTTYKKRIKWRIGILLHSVRRSMSPPRIQQIIQE